MKLLYQTHSPYARKVLVMLHEIGLADEVEVMHHETSPTLRNETVFAANPLGKVPILLLDDGATIFDSTVICDYLDRCHDGPSLIPPERLARLRTLRLQAVAQGLADAGIALRWELTRRPEALRWPKMAQGQAEKIRAAYHYSCIFWNSLNLWATMIQRSWTRSASIEETLALWAASLREIKKRIRPLFTQERVATNAGLFLEGLLGDEQRKTGWMRAEAAGDPGPWRQQAILGRGDWDADALRDIVRDYAIEHLADNDAVLVIDETGFLKQGKASCGVARQYTGSAGKITNCQIGVFAAYVSRHGHAFIDRALYLPKEWTDDPDRLEAAYVPPDTGFATKPKLATRMIAGAITASVPFSWVAGDTVYGVGELEQQLRRAGKGYVLGVSSAHVFQSWGKRSPVAGKADDIARTLRPSDWKRLPAGAGTKGPRLHDWCYLELANLEAEQFNSANDGLWTRGLLIRRRIVDGDLAFFTTWCPAGTSIETLVAVEGHRWAIEDSFETAKNEFGLDHNESRSWHGWHRHVSLVMLAFAMMAAIRRRVNSPLPKKTKRRTTEKTEAAPRRH